VTDVSQQSVALDAKMCRILSIVGIPSAFLLHGYVGFIFGSIKANPWWGNVLMPIMFILSAIVSGIALCVFNYMALNWIRRKTVNMRCLDTMAMFLFYALVVDAAVEGLDYLHRGYAAEEGYSVIQLMIREKLFYTLYFVQIGVGTLLPLLLLGSLQLLSRRVPEAARRCMIFASGVMILLGVLGMRWNVVMGGQFFSKSLRGVMSYKMEFTGQEGWLLSAVILCLPFIILTVLVKLFLSEQLQISEHVPQTRSTP
jgi:Ni/Fe-hydrogenase subunit HybB-like protein